MTEEKGKQNVEKAKNEELTSNKEDEELSALLDSALEDFNAPPKKNEKVESSQKKQKDGARPTPPDTLWNEEFLQQTTARLGQMQSLFSPGDGAFSAEELGENLQRLAEAATHIPGDDASPDTEFSNIIAQTLKNLSENAENLQNQFSDDDLMNMLGSFGNPNGDTNELLPFMQQMMQSLLSKDILHPALISIIEKYPQWLEDNKSKLSSHDFQRYSEQLKLMKEVCEELEKESPNDSSDVKNSRFEKILGLMQRMQDCGQPPAELAGDLGPMLSMDEFGNPQMPANLNPNQCSLM